MKKILTLILILVLFSSCEENQGTKVDDANNNVAFISENLSKQNEAIVSDEKEGSIKESFGFEKVKIKRVVDGDTAIADIDGQEIKLRFIGVDTPETKDPRKEVQYFGKEASDFTKNSLEGETVYLEKDISDKDRYNRYLRYVWLEIPKNPNNITRAEIEEKMFNAILLKEGYALTSTFPPDVKYEDIFTDISRKARENSKGLWANPDNIGKAAKGEEITDNSKEEGLIKGNINSKIYHLPGGKSYNSIKEENVVYFKTEEEAKEAGFRKAKN